MTDSDTGQQGPPAPAATGDPRVDAAIEPLASLEETELTERPAVLESVHDQLRDILGELGEPAAEPGRPGQQAELGTAAPGAPRPGGPAAPRPAPPRPERGGAEFRR
jgi:hypothetical protein